MLLASRNRVLFVATVSGALMLLLVFSSWHSPFQRRLSGIDDEEITRRSHVVIASEFNQHFDVHLAVAHTLQQLVLRDNGHVQVFAHMPLLHGFQEVVDSLHLYDGEIWHPDELVAYMRSDMNYPEEPGKMTDLLLFGTCEVDMNRWSDELLNVWDTRPDNQKFMIVCIAHHFRDTNWQRHITAWSRRRSIRLLPIGYHVGRAFRTHFLELADSTDPDIYKALYEYIDIDVHAPVLDLPDYVDRPRRSVPSRAVIQGNFQVDRRDYPHIFEDLLAALKRNPEAWGYKSLARDRNVYEPLDASPDETFELHLIGEGQLEIPRALSKAVFIHRGLNYTDFYALMQQMDIVIPAFVNVDYYDFQASSTVAMAVQCNTPILASRRMRKAYGYIDEDRVTITRPQALREIPAIGALRGVYPPSLDLTSWGSEKLSYDVDAMISAGWQRPEEGFKQFKKELWEQNRLAVTRILEDAKGIV